MRLSEIKKDFGGSTWAVFFLVPLTGGMYYLIWLARREKLFDKLAGRRVYGKYLLVLAAIFFWTSMFQYAIGNLAPGLVLGAIYGVSMLVITFRIANFIENYAAETLKIYVHLNRFWLLVFNILYMNYFFNKLDVVELKHDAVTSHAVSESEQESIAA